MKKIFIVFSLLITCLSYLEAMEREWEVIESEKGEESPPHKRKKELTASQYAEEAEKFYQLSRAGYIKVHNKTGYDIDVDVAYKVGAVLKKTSIGVIKENDTKTIGKTSEVSSVHFDFPSSWYGKISTWYSKPAEKPYFFNINENYRKKSNQDLTISINPEGNLLSGEWHNIAITIPSIAEALDRQGQTVRWYDFFSSNVGELGKSDKTVSPYDILEIEDPRLSKIKQSPEEFCKKLENQRDTINARAMSRLEKRLTEGQRGPLTRDVREHIEFAYEEIKNKYCPKKR